MDIILQTWEYASSLIEDGVWNLIQVYEVRHLINEVAKCSADKKHKKNL
jgi:hypothetical protein